MQGSIEYKSTRQFDVICPTSSIFLGNCLADTPPDKSVRAKLPHESVVSLMPALAASLRHRLLDNKGIVDETVLGGMANSVDKTCGPFHGHGKERPGTKLAHGSSIYGSLTSTERALNILMEEHVRAQSEHSFLVQDAVRPITCSCESIGSPDFSTVQGNGFNQLSV